MFACVTIKKTFVSFHFIALAVTRLLVQQLLDPCRDGIANEGRPFLFELSGIERCRERTCGRPLVIRPDRAWPSILFSAPLSGRAGIRRGDLRLPLRLR